MSSNNHFTPRFATPSNHNPEVSRLRPKHSKIRTNPTLEILETPTSPTSASPVSISRHGNLSRVHPTNNPLRRYTNNLEDEEVIDLVTPPFHTKGTLETSFPSNSSMPAQWDYRSPRNDGDDSSEEEDEDDFLVSSLHQALNDLNDENDEESLDEVVVIGNNADDNNYGDEDESLEVREETEEERKEREEKESMELARHLMAEEAMASYNASAAYLDENPDNLPQEDLEALRMFAQEAENEAYVEVGINEDDDDSVEVEEDLSYETMLRLGERIGDVKQERWAVVAKSKIDLLPVICHDCIEVEGIDENDSKCKCLVCQFPYESGEFLRVLPCGHRFHAECVDQWLEQKDFCPYCRQSIVESN